MDETFLININCSSILFDSQETQYTMFIDTTKISIVYELVEWIRWIFSVESCIYLTHDNSVIHELEDIRVLFKLKNFVIKPCLRPHCVHKKTYRTLLNNLNLFVNWNEMKVHKFFLEKFSQVDGKLQQEKLRINNSPKKTVTELSPNFTESEHINKRNINISPEKSCDNVLSNSSLSNYSFYTKKTVPDNPKSESATFNRPSIETNCTFKKENAKENLLIHFEDSSDCSNNFANVDGRNKASKTKNCVNFERSPKANKDLEVKDQTKKNFSKSNLNKKSHKFIRPFSLGEILSNIREDLAKQNDQNAFEKNSSSHVPAEEENFDETINPDNLFVNKVIGGKKRQRIRKRKKSKKQDTENENLISPVLQSNSGKTFDIFHSFSNFKPNHIRFDEKEDLMETDPPHDEFEMKNIIDQKSNDSDGTFVTTETTKLTDVSENFSKETVINPLESKIENNTDENEDKIRDLDGQMCSNNIQSYNAVEGIKSNSFSPDLNMLLSIKEKLKSPVVVNRFY